MVHPYIVNAGMVITHKGITYTAGQIVYLTYEEAGAYAGKITPNFDTSNDPDPPFESFLIAHKGQDLIASYWIEQDREPSTITSIVGTALTVSAPHGLTGSVRINLRYSSPTISDDMPLLVTVASATQFTLPSSITLPPNTTYQEVGYPVDLTGSTFTGGIYNYLTAEETIVLNGTAKTTLASPIVHVTSQSEIEAGKFEIEDRITIADGFVSEVICVGKSGVVKNRDCSYSCKYQVSLNAIAPLEDQYMTARRTVSTNGLGALLGGKSFAFSGNYEYGRLNARLESTQFDDLPYGFYPFQIRRSLGTLDTVLFNGIVEVAV